jgi:hypothetical protein
VVALFAVLYVAMKFSVASRMSLLAFSTLFGTFVTTTFWRRLDILTDGIGRDNGSVGISSGRGRSSIQETKQPRYTRDGAQAGRWIWHLHGLEISLVAFAVLVFSSPSQASAAITTIMVFQLSSQVQGALALLGLFVVTFALCIRIRRAMASNTDMGFGRHESSQEKAYARVSAVEGVHESKADGNAGNVIDEKRDENDDSRVCKTNLAKSSDPPDYAHNRLSIWLCNLWATLVCVSAASAFLILGASADNRMEFQWENWKFSRSGASGESSSKSNEVMKYLALLCLLPAAVLLKSLEARFSSFLMEYPQHRASDVALWVNVMQVAFSAPLLVANWFAAQHFSGSNWKPVAANDFSGTDEEFEDEKDFAEQGQQAVLLLVVVSIYVGTALYFSCFDPICCATRKTQNRDHGIAHGLGSSIRCIDFSKDTLEMLVTKTQVIERD